MSGAALHIEGTRLLRETLESAVAITVHEGGSGSSKTFSIVQALLALSFQERNQTYSVVRLTMPALEKGALEDFRNALELARIGGPDGPPASSAFHGRSSPTVYTNKQTGTKIEFFSVDKPQKARGPRRDRLFCNEGNELPEETFRELARRTRGQIIIDYNPSMRRHWIYDSVLTRADCLHITSTYRDNPYLTERNRREIEADVPVYEEPDGTLREDWDLSYSGKGTLVAGDPYLWSVFGLGQRGAPGEAIYPALFESVGFDWGPGGSSDTVVGLDFGYSHPMAMLRVGQRDVEPRPELHFDELVFGSGLTLDDLLTLLPEAGVSKTDTIYADGSRPEMIEQMNREGYNVLPADKGPGSVFAGINFLKKHKLCFTRRSQNSRDQFADYRWKKHADGTVLDEPVKLNDDAPDAGRYGAYTHWSSPAIDWTRA